MGSVDRETNKKLAGGGFQKPLGRGLTGVARREICKVWVEWQHCLLQGSSQGLFLGPEGPKAEAEAPLCLPSTCALSVETGT